MQPTPSRRRNPAAGKATDQRISGPAEYVDDLDGDFEEIDLLGHTLILDGKHFDTAILGRWLGLDAYRRKAVEDGRGAELDDYLFAIFADAILPANPSYTTESLRVTFPLFQAWIGVLRHFTSWRAAKLSSGDLIEVRRTVRPATQLSEVRRTG